MTRDHDFYLVDDDGNDPTEPPLAPYLRRRAPKRPAAPTKSRVVSLPVGDAQRLRAPGEGFAVELFPQVEMRPVQLQLTQYPVGGAGERCRWPIEACCVGDRAVDGAMALYDGLDGAPTCRVGQLIRLRLRNPLAVPAAVCGALIGRTLAAEPCPPWAAIGGFIGGAVGPTPLTDADLERMVREAAGVNEPRAHCYICNAFYPSQHEAQVGWVHVASDKAFCAACVAARGGADAFMLYRATHDGAVPPAGSVPCVDCGVATPGYVVAAHAGSHCEACARKHRSEACAICGEHLREAALGWVVVDNRAYCPRCVTQRGGAEAFISYATLHDGVVPPVGYSPAPARPATAQPACFGGPRVGCSADECAWYAACLGKALRRAEDRAAGKAPAKLPTTAKELLRALGDPPGLVERDVGAIIVPPPAPRVVYYCEAAPPREVVEGTPCVHDGDALGAVPLRDDLRVRGHLRWTARMRVAWERHEAHQRTYGDRAADAAVSHDVAACRAAHDRRAARLDRDVAPPEALDAYGGCVVRAAASTVGGALAGWRCALCGAWLRKVAR